MRPLQLSEGLLREALAELRSCGAGQRECVVYFTGPLAHPDTADATLHPDHSASAGGYRVHDRWLSRAWLQLAQEHRAIRAQVHTHPGVAYHSAIDDDFPVVQTAGFLSLVIPRFAQDPMGLEGAHLAELQEDGRFVAVSIADRLVIA